VWLLGKIVISALAALGVALSCLEFLRRAKAKRSSYVCLCFREDLIDSGAPDMIIICRTDTDEEEIIKRIGKRDQRQIYLKYM